MSGSSYPSTRCAACKYLRRRCTKDCGLAPYFPSNNHARFASVHKIFGAGNVSRMLQRLPELQRAQAAESIICEAALRVKYPIHGSVGIIQGLCQQIEICERELVQTRAQIYNLASQLLPPPDGGTVHQSREQGMALEDQEQLYPSRILMHDQQEEGVCDQRFLDFYPNFPDLP